MDEDDYDKCKENKMKSYLKYKKNNMRLDSIDEESDPIKSKKSEMK